MVSRQQALSATKPLASRYGIVSVRQIANELRKRGQHCTTDAVRTALRRTSKVSWLGNAYAWLWLPGKAHNRLRARLYKALAVAGHIAIDDLSALIRRDAKSDGRVPPTHILMEYCRQEALVELNDRRIEATDQLADSEPLSETESAIVELLREYGPLLQREDLISLAEQAGMKSGTVHVLLSTSPVVCRYGRGVYGLIGADVAPGDVEILQGEHRHRKVLLGWSWDGCGEILLRCRVSRAVKEQGRMHLASALRDYLSGSFTLQDHLVAIHAVGTELLGLRPLMERATIGTTLVLRFHLASGRFAFGLGGDIPASLERNGLGTKKRPVSSQIVPVSCIKAAW